MLRLIIINKFDRVCIFKTGPGLCFYHRRSLYRYRRGIIPMIIWDAINIAALWWCDRVFEMCGTLQLHRNKKCTFSYNMWTWLIMIKADVELRVVHCVCFANRDNFRNNRNMCSENRTWKKISPCRTPRSMLKYVYREQTMVDYITLQYSSLHVKIYV